MNMSESFTPTWSPDSTAHQDQYMSWTLIQTSFITVNSIIKWICLCCSQMTPGSICALLVSTVMYTDAGKCLSTQWGEEEYPTREKYTQSASIHWMCNKYTQFYLAAFYFLGSFSLHASLHRLYWTALRYLSPYNVPSTPTTRAPQENRAILGCNVWNIVSKL